MLGFQTAAHVVRLGRSAFFGDSKADLPIGRTSVLEADDLVPQFGFVGPKYEDLRVLVIGINPAAGGTRTGARTPADERMMPALHRFAEEPTERHFESASAAYERECRSWPRIWKRHCEKFVNEEFFDYESIAFVSCLPWRTGSGTAFSDAVARATARLYIRPLLDELSPRLIIAVSKRCRSILELAGLPRPRTITWNMSQASTEKATEERDVALREMRDWLQDARH